MSPEQEPTDKFCIRSIEIACSQDGNGSLSLSSNEIIDQFPDLSIFFEDYLNLGVGINDGLISLIVSSGCAQYIRREEYSEEETPPLEVSFAYGDAHRLTVEARVNKTSDEFQVSFYKTPLE
jgi:hypothetical protein